MKYNPRPQLLSSLLCCAIICLSSCGKKNETPPAAASGDTAPAGGGSKWGKPGAAPADGKSAAAAPKKPAPPVVIVPRPIDLMRDFSLPDGAEKLGMGPANVNYKVKGDAKGVYEFNRKQFLARGWKEGTDTSVTEQSVSGQFSGAGFRISATVYSVGEPGSVNVMLHNHGNIDLTKLPLPPAVKPVYVGPLSAMYVTEAAVADTVEATKKLLLAAGWEPHGSAGDSLYFKKGMNRITATIGAAPAQGGKTMISYTSEAMAGDLSAPPDASDVRYVDTQQKLTFETTSDKNGIIGFYKTKLAKDGWKPNRDETYRIDDYDEMVLRNPAGDVIFLKIRGEREGRRNVSVEYLSAADMADMNKRLDAQAAAAKAKKEKEQAK